MVVNLYLTAGGRNHYVHKKLELESLLHLPDDIHTFILGDFNFTERPEDEIAYKPLAKNTQVAWEAVKTRFRLREAAQPHFTFYRVSPDNHHRSAASRIDRIYTSLNEADLTLVDQVACIASVPHPLHKHIIRASGVRARSTTHSTDHTPVSLRFVSSAPSRRRKFSIPKWLPLAQEFRTSFLQNWTPINTPTLDPVKDMSDLNTAIIATAKKLLKSNSGTSPVGSLGELSQAIAIFRAINSSHATHEKILNIVGKYPNLSHLYHHHDRIASYHVTTAFINNILADAVPDERSDTERTAPDCLPDPEEDTDDNAENPIIPPSDPDARGPPVFRPANSSPYLKAIAQAKLYLPSTRRRLVSLCPPSNGGAPMPEPTEVPSEMAAHINDFWQPIYSARADGPDSTSIAQHFDDIDYHKTVPGNVMPLIPSQDALYDTIMSSGNSCPGRNGIPFGAYRTIPDYAAPIFHSLVVHIASGGAPPPDFNFGRLFLIPKTASPEVDRMRPITVNNTDNRIIAKAVTAAITPAIDHIVSPEQKGFIPGRQGADHIRTLNEDFYSAAMRKRSHYILFLDTAKAFDSIDHVYIFALLRRVGMPTWFVTTLTSLLANVRSYPVLSEETSTFLDISRGVKQGCPLSPILFALCYDPLLHALNSIDNNTNCAFADDLAISSPSLSSIIASMPIIDDFKAISGLGINVDKTHIITACPITANDRHSLTSAPNTWSDVTFSNESTYLGIRMGRRVTTADIYASPLKKLRDRFQLYAPTLSSLPPHQRIININVFILSLFSYHIQFFLIPYPIILEINSLCQKAVLSFGGKAFGYHHLTIHRSAGGLKQPLKDIWAAQATRLASQYPLETHHGLPSADHPDPDKDYLTQFHSSQSMLISDHIAAAGLEYLNAWSPRDNNDNIVVDLPISPLGVVEGYEAKRRKFIYKRLVDKGWAKNRIDGPSGLKKKLSRWTADPERVDILLSRWKLLTTSLPSHIYYYQILMLHNAIPTERRREPAMRIPTRGLNGDNPCFLCGLSHQPPDPDKLTDSLEHILGHCPVSRRARTIFHASISLPPPSTFIPSHMLLTPSTDKKLTNAIVSFNYSLFYLHRVYFMTLNNPPSLDIAASRIAHLSLTNWISHSPKKWHPAARVRRAILPDWHPAPYTSPPKKRKVGFGSAGKRTPAQQQEAKAYANSLIASAPSTCILAFTDGSSNPNPGPCGAGAYLYENDSDWETESIAALGHGSNNLTELWAIGMATQLAMLRIRSREGTSNTHLHVYTDSSYARRQLLGSSPPNAHRSLITALRDLISTIPPHIKFNIYWVPGHAGLQPNEHADLLADLGSARSASGNTNTNFNNGIINGNFIPY